MVKFSDVSVKVICLLFISSNTKSTNTNVLSKADPKLYLVQMKTKIRSDMKDSGKDYVAIAYNDENYEYSNDYMDEFGSGEATEDYASGGASDQEINISKETAYAADLDLSDIRETSHAVPLDLLNLQLKMCTGNRCSKSWLYRF